MHVQPMNKCRSSKKLQYRVRNSESVFLYKSNQFSKGLDTDYSSCNPFQMYFVYNDNMTNLPIGANSKIICLIK
jgi:ribosome biogenesis protein Nip4